MTTRHAGRVPAVPRALVLLPSAVGEVARWARGDHAGAARCACARGGLAGGGARPASAAVLVHGVLSGVLGAAAWFLTGLLVLGGVRGPFYGFVDPGPYDHSWGGPSLAGAWAVHAAVWVLLIPLWVLLTRALSGLQRALTARLLDRRGPWWAVPVTLAVAAGAVLVVRAWVHQL